MVMDKSNPDILQRMAAAPEASAWVAASAGSGKTKVLSDRVLNLLLNGTPPEKILCLTFTRTAAAEMSNRIAERLAKWATAAEDTLENELAALSGKAPEEKQKKKARRLFARLLDTPGGLKIMTIHGFCQSLLKRFPLEAGVSPQFDVLDEAGARDLIEQAQNRVLSQAKFAAELELITLLTDEEGFTKAMEAMTFSLHRLEKLSKEHPDQVKKLYEKALNLPENSSRNEMVRSFCSITDNRLEGLRTAVRILEKGSGKKDKETAVEINRFLSLTIEQKELAFEKYLSLFLTEKDDIRKALVHKDTEEALPFMAAEAERAFDLRQKLKSELVLRASIALNTLGIAVMKEYALLKAYRSMMDYDDLIAATRRLLEKSGAAAWVLFKLDGGIDHILVDEAQDTSPAQWAIVRDLAEEFFAGNGARMQNRTLFAVGDKKQSIYSFQGAAPEEFENMRLYFKQKAIHAEKKWNDVPMYISFRSVPAVIDTVNHVLRNPAAADGVLDEGEDGTHLSWRKADAGLVEIWPTEKAETTDRGKAFTKPVERIHSESASSRLAKKIALRIRRMIDQKEILESEGRPIQPGDILILVRRRNAFIENLSRELKALDVPVSGVDRLKIASHIAVMDLMVLGDFLLLPEDDLSLATVLKSPLCNLTEEELFELAYDRGGQTLLTRLAKHKNEADSSIGKAYAFLTDLLNRADKMRPYELFSYVLGTLGGQKAFISRLGYQAVDALDEFMSLALKYDLTNTPSLQKFLRWIRKNDVEIKRDPDQKTFDAVRMMTVHGAKGLQAPVVFLPDTRHYTFHTPSYFWIDEKLPLWVPNASYRDAAAEKHKEISRKKEIEEYNRLLYVAMTRAADRLYICGWENKTPAPANNWYDLIRHSFTVSDGKGTVSSFAEEINDPLFDEPVLRLASSQKTPVEYKKRTDKSPKQAEIPAWAFLKAPEEPTPPRPLMPSRPEEDILPFLSPLSENREKSLLRGTLIHGLLDLLPKQEKSKREKAALIYLEKHGISFSETEKNTIASDVLRILNTPGLTHLFADSLSEVPVTGIVNGRVISGQIDRLLVSENEVLIIDYKSNHVIPETPSEVPAIYQQQMSAYASLLQEIYSNRKIRCFLLWTEKPELMEITSLVH